MSGQNSTEFCADTLLTFLLIRTKNKKASVNLSF